jgi:hypothetical protein
MYIVLLIIFTVLSQSFLISTIGSKLIGSDNVLENKYNAYASEKGQDRMDTRYSEGYQSGNNNYRLLRNVREVANKIAIPLLLFVLYMNRKKFTTDKIILDLFNISIACLAVTNLMLNISQGERFYYFNGFMALAAFVYFIQKVGWNSLRFRYLLYLIIPSILLNNLLSLILVKNLVSSDFLISNFPLELFRLF